MCTNELLWYNFSVPSRIPICEIVVTQIWSLCWFVTKILASVVVVVGWLWGGGGNSTGLFKMIVGVLTTCLTQYTWDRSICVLLFNRTTLQVFCYIPYRCCLRIYGSIGAITHSYLKCIVYDKVLKPSVCIGVCSCTDGSRNSQRASVRYVTKLGVFFF